MSKYKFAIIFSMPLNFIVLLAVRHFFGMEMAVLLGITTVIGKIDEFGYYFKEKLTTQQSSEGETR